MWKESSCSENRQVKQTKREKDSAWPISLESPDPVWREPILEIVDEVKVERAELGGSHGTTSEESKESFQMDEEWIQRLGRRKRSQ